MILKNGIYNSRENIELRTALLDAERLKSPSHFTQETAAKLPALLASTPPTSPSPYTILLSAGALFTTKGIVLNGVRYHKTISHRSKSIERRHDNGQI